MSEFAGSIFGGADAFAAAVWGVRAFLCLYVAGMALALAWAIAKGVVALFRCGDASAAPEGDPGAVPGPDAVE